MRVPAVPAVLLFAVITLFGCSRSNDTTEGPAAAVSAVAPAAVCAQQVASTVKVSGSGLSPLHDEKLKDGRLEVPQLDLVRTATIDGASVDPGDRANVVRVPDDPAHPELSDVTWTSQQQMGFLVCPPGTCSTATPPHTDYALPAGLFSLRVTNRNGSSATVGDALTVVPIPVVTTVDVPPVCTDVDAAINLKGDFLLKIDGQPSSVKIGDKSFTPEMTGCHALPSSPSTKVESCTGMSVKFPAKTFPPGNYDVVVNGPGSAACHSTAKITLKIVPPPTITSVAPVAMCAGGGTLKITGTDFETGATVTVGSVPLANAATVAVSDGGKVADATFGEVPIGGPYDVTLKNPSGCSAVSPAKVTVTPGPIVVFVAPGVVWNGMNTPVTIFTVGSSGSFDSVKMTLSGGGTPIVLTFSPAPGHPERPIALIPKDTPIGDYDVTLVDSVGCQAVLPKAVTVTATPTVTLTVSPTFGWTSSPTPITLTSTAGPGFSALPSVYILPSGGTTTSIVGSIAIGSPTKLTGVVPSGLAAGQYDIVVVNQDKSVGVISKGFTIVSKKPPQITSVTPAQVLNTLSTQAISIAGTDFRGGLISTMPTVLFRCVDATGKSIADKSLTVDSFTSTTIKATLKPDDKDFKDGANCLVVVTNGDDGASAEFSAVTLVTINQELAAFNTGPVMGTKREALGVASGGPTTASRFLYAVGGDDGTNALKTVEALSIDNFGKPGTGFFTQRNTMATARTQTSAVRIGRFIYVVGGASKMTSTSALDTVERAVILDSSTVPTELNVDLGISTTSGLDGGLYFYRVAAVMPSDDAFNPAGETLPSEVFGLNLPKLPGYFFKVTLTWKAVPTAIGYRIYRSAAGGAAGSETLIADTSPTATLPATVTCASATACTDGGATSGTKTPLAIGSTGVWTTLAKKMSTPRQGAGVTWAMDPGSATTAYIYAFGGLDDAGTALSSNEFLTITIAVDGSQDASAGFKKTTSSLTNARWRLRGYVATPKDSSLLDGTYVWAGGGASAYAGSAMSDFEGALVSTGGDIGAFVPVGGASSPGLATPASGFGAFAAGDYLYVIGGVSGLPSKDTSSAKYDGTTPPKVGAWNTGSNGMKTPRLDLGAADVNGFFYLVGGSTTGGTVTDSIEYVLY